MSERSFRLQAGEKRREFVMLSYRRAGLQPGRFSRDVSRALAPEASVDEA